jgi:hypothetical protein
MFQKIMASILMISSMALSQNLQLHYEASADREYLVSTLEMFKPDQYGSTFWFVDMEYDAFGVKGASLAYWEIARSFTLPVNNLSATIQYNDGVANFGSLGQVWLLGVNYYLDLGFVAFPLDILYRAAQGADKPDLQLTTTWFIPLLDGNIEFSGFMDLWSQDNIGSSGKQLVLLSEPQLWYNANKHFSIGSEIEISRNFIFGKTGIQALPTLGLRWTF